MTPQDLLYKQFQKSPDNPYVLAFLHQTNAADGFLASAVIPTSFNIYSIVGTPSTVSIKRQ